MDYSYPQHSTKVYLVEKNRKLCFWYIKEENKTANTMNESRDNNEGKICKKEKMNWCVQKSYPPTFWGKFHNLRPIPRTTYA